MSSNIPDFALTTTNLITTEGGKPKSLQASPK